MGDWLSGVDAFLAVGAAIVAAFVIGVVLLIVAIIYHNWIAAGLLGLALGMGGYKVFR